MLTPQAVEQHDGLTIEPYNRDEDLLRATLADGEPRLRIYPFAGLEVVLGRGSRPERELHLEPCRADRVRISRRRGGGCAVVLDPGNVVLALTLPVAGIGDNLRHFQRITGWLTAGLARLEIHGVQQRGISDLALGQRKVGGACIYRTRGLLFYSTTLLARADTEAMQRYLRHPPREPDYRAGRPHRLFVGNLGAQDAHGLAQALRQTLDPGQLAH